MMQEDSSQAFFTNEQNRRYDNRAAPATYSQPVVQLEHPAGNNESAQRYTSFGVDQGQPSVMQEDFHQQAIYNERKNNFPPCKPMVYHDIQAEIPSEKRLLVKRAYFGWYVHAICLAFNFVCMFGALVKSAALIGFFISLVALLLGVPISFWVYWLFYSSLRKASPFYYCLWVCFFALQIGIEILYAIGIETTGGSGFMMMLTNFSKSVVLGSMFAVCTFMWVAIAIYNIYFFNYARREYSAMGGNQAATREFGKVAVTAAYDNRDTLKQVAIDNKDTIKKVAVENKDTIIQFARDNRQEISRVAVENKDVIWENRDVVASVFDDTPQQGARHAV